MKRYCCWFLAALLFACGCSSGPRASGTQETVSAFPSASPPTSLLQETLTFSSSDSVSGFTATSGLLPHHILSVGPGVTLDADALSLDKVNNEMFEISDDTLYTGNEALIYTDGSVLRLNSSMISGTAPYAHALCLDNGSVCDMDRSILVTTDTGQAAVAVFDASSIRMTGCILASTGDGAQLRKFLYLCRVN